MSQFSTTLVINYVFNFFAKSDKDDEEKEKENDDEIDEDGNHLRMA